MIEYIAIHSQTQQLSMNKECLKDKKIVHVLTQPSRRP